MGIERQIDFVRHYSSVFCAVWRKAPENVRLQLGDKDVDK